MTPKIEPTKKFKGYFFKLVRKPPAFSSCQIPAASADMTTKTRFPSCQRNTAGGTTKNVPNCARHSGTRHGHRTGIGAQFGDLRGNRRRGNQSRGPAAAVCRRR